MSESSLWRHLMGGKLIGTHTHICKVTAYSLQSKGVSLAWIEGPPMIATFPNTMSHPPCILSGTWFPKLKVTQQKSPPVFLKCVQALDGYKAVFQCHGKKNKFIGNFSWKSSPAPPTPPNSSESSPCSQHGLSCNRLENIGALGVEWPTSQRSGGCSQVPCAREVRLKNILGSTQPHMSKKCILIRDKRKASYPTGFYWLGLTNDLIQANDLTQGKKPPLGQPINPISNIPAPAMLPQHPYF